MNADIHAEKILILDFGSQYTQLIARRVREIGVYCEIWAFDTASEAISEFAPNGIILSGGPESVTESDTPRVSDVVFESGVPVLGICYGMQAMAQQLGGEVESSNKREFGYANVEVVFDNPLLEGISDHLSEDGTPLLEVWMSHGDKVSRVPNGFELIAKTDSAPIAAIADTDRAVSMACNFILK